MSSLFSLLFAPSFLILIRYFEFNAIVLLYILLSVIFFIYAYKKQKKLEDFIVIATYFVLLCIAYFSTSFNTIKFIPIFTSMIFVAIFIDAALHKKELILKFTKKFYKKPIPPAEINYLKNGDSFWAVALSLYMFILIGIVFLGNDLQWAFMSSIGWYIYFVLTLISQILYGKLYAIKMYS
ncbi:hypothetical protein [Sulfurimonas sp.]|uniref:hypothetical protein n=1 Tax=Sulfurimonas sp. TaxID=2022749 RepID=UPI002AB09B20|nr:hypothetical protein [Sulfurimonas sp.]